MESVEVESAVLSAREADLEPCQVMDLLALNHELGAQVQQLDAAVRSHRRIGIATGLVMAHHDIAEDVILAGRLPPVLVGGRPSERDADGVAGDRPETRFKAGPRLRAELKTTSCRAWAHLQTAH